MQGGGRVLEAQRRRESGGNKNRWTGRARMEEGMMGGGMLDGGKEPGGSAPGKRMQSRPSLAGPLVGQDTSVEDKQFVNMGDKGKEGGEITRDAREPEKVWIRTRKKGAR